MTEANSCARLSVVGVLPGLTTHPQKLSGAIVSAPKGLDDMRLRRRHDPTAPTYGLSVHTICNHPTEDLAQKNP